MSEHHTRHPGLERTNKNQGRKGGGGGVADARDQAKQGVETDAELRSRNRNQVVQDKCQQSRQFVFANFSLRRQNLDFNGFHNPYIARAVPSASEVACFYAFPRKVCAVVSPAMKWLPLLAFTVLLAACSTQTTRPTAAQLNSDAYTTLYLGANGGVVSKQTKAGKPQSTGYWRGDGVEGAASITIDLGHQEAYFYKGGKLVGMSPISSGREGYRTPTGRFSIIQKNKNHRSNLYGDYVDAGGAVVMKGIGVIEDPRPAGTSFRGAPMPYFMRIVNGVGLHAGYLPGMPDSHGCIRMPENMAEIFFANVSLGTPVTVTH